MGKADQGIRGGKSRYLAIPRALVFLRNGGDVLLLKGAAGKRIWANQYNGVGGHIEEDEDILSAAKREALEETGVEIDEVKLQAVVNINAGEDNLGILMFVFTAWTSQRLTHSSEEGELHWIPVKDLDQYDLVEDLRWLLPRILVGEKGSKPLFLYYDYDEDDRLRIREHS